MRAFNLSIETFCDRDLAPLQLGVKRHLAQELIRSACTSDYIFVARADVGLAGEVGQRDGAHREECLIAEEFGYIAAATRAAALWTCFAPLLRESRARNSSSLGGFGGFIAAHAGVFCSGQAPDEACRR